MEKENVEFTREDDGIVIIDEGIDKNEVVERACCFGPIVPLAPE